MAIELGFRAVVWNCKEQGLRKGRAGTCGIKFDINLKTNRPEAFYD